jgi:hypothetical protein
MTYGQGLWQTAPKLRINRPKTTDQPPQNYGLIAPKLRANGEKPNKINDRRSGNQEYKNLEYQAGTEKSLTQPPVFTHLKRRNRTAQEG